MHPLMLTSLLRVHLHHHKLIETQDWYALVSACREPGRLRRSPGQCLRFRPVMVRLLLVRAGLPSLARSCLPVRCLCCHLCHASYHASHQPRESGLAGLNQRSRPRLPTDPAVRPAAPGPLRRPARSPRRSIHVAMHHTRSTPHEPQARHHASGSELALCNALTLPMLVS